MIHSQFMDGGTASYIPTSTTGHLFVGSFADALDHDQLWRNRISLVLTVCCPSAGYRTALKSLYAHLGIHHFERYVQDLPAQVLNFNNLCLEAIHSALLRGHNVLVHCQAGISRSVSVCMAYLIIFQEKSFSDALRLMRRQRPISSPNVGFLHQLFTLSERWKSETEAPRNPIRFRSELSKHFSVKTVYDRDRLPPTNRLISMPVANYAKHFPPADFGGHGLMHDWPLFGYY